MQTVPLVHPWQGCKVKVHSGGGRLPLKSGALVCSIGQGGGWGEPPPPPRVFLPAKVVEGNFPQPGVGPAKPVVRNGGVGSLLGCIVSMIALIRCLEASKVTVRSFWTLRHGCGHEFKTLAPSPACDQPIAFDRALMNLAEAIDAGCRGETSVFGIAVGAAPHSGLLEQRLHHHNTNACSTIATCWIGQPAAPPTELATATDSALWYTDAAAAAQQHPGPIELRVLQYHV